MVRDGVGYGIYVFVIVVGFFVVNVSYKGFGGGIVRGVGFYVCIVMYKICWGKFGCFIFDVFKVIDYSICDGVDVILILIGVDVFVGFEIDISDVLFGLFYVVMKGIFVVCFVGNEGLNV